MTEQAPEPRRAATWLVTAVFLAASAAAGGYAWTHRVEVRTFRNPVAYCVCGDRLLVIEKERNTLLELARREPGGSLELVRAAPIEPDDGEFYYMVRALYPGRGGVVAESHIYKRRSQSFVGYRYREYTRGSAAPKDILTVFLADPASFPEVTFDVDPAGGYCFAHNIAGMRRFWRVAGEGGSVIRGAAMPPDVEAFGPTNDADASWASICCATNGVIHVASRVSGRIETYDRDGRRLGDIGNVGFAEGEILAPERQMVFAFAPGEPPRLTVASSGNRTWVQFDGDGRPVRTVAPLQAGYPFRDILVGRWFAGPGGAPWTFDLANRVFVEYDGSFRVTAGYVERRTVPALAAAGASLVFLLAGLFCRRCARALDRLAFPAFVKLLLLVVPLLVASAWLVGGQVREILKEDLDAESVRRSANLARAVVNSLSLDDLEAIQKPADREGEAYERVASTLRRIVDVEHVDQTPKWILHKIRDGRYYYGVSVWRGAIFEPFIVPPGREMFFRALAGKTPQWGRFTDDQGEWFSYLQPVLDRAGEVIYVLELYRPTELMDRAEARATERMWKLAGLTLVVAVALALLFAFVFTQPLRDLARGAKIVSAGGFDHRIRVRTRDEVGRFGRVFNQMTADLKTYTEDLARATAARERMESELRFAREIQQGVLPRSFPPFPGAESVEIGALVEPAREIGGDYYDFFLVDRDHVGVVVADVSGKGLPAGLFLMMVRTALRDCALHNLSAADTLVRANALIAADNPASMFATLFYFICNRTTGRVIFSNAGHPPPIRVSAAGIREVAVEAAGGLVLGAVEDARYQDGELVLAPGESLVLYTDGVTEAIDAGERMYGIDRLLACLRAHAAERPQGVCDAVLRDVLDYQRGREQFDDITVLAFAFRPPPA